MVETSRRPRSGQCVVFEGVLARERMLGRKIGSGVQGFWDQVKREWDELPEDKKHAYLEQGEGTNKKGMSPEPAEAVVPEAWCFARQN